MVQQGISDADAVKAVGKLSALLRDHVRKTTGGEIAYIWTQEYGAIICGHVHMLLHLPADYTWQGQRMLSRMSWNKDIRLRVYRYVETIGIVHSNSAALSIWPWRHEGVFSNRAPQSVVKAYVISPSSTAATNTLVAANKELPHKIGIDAILRGCGYSIVFNCYSGDGCR